MLVDGVVHGAHGTRDVRDGGETVGDGPPRPLRGQRGRPRGPHGRLRALPRRPGQQHVVAGDRGGRRVRGARGLPRWEAARSPTPSCSRRPTCLTPTTSPSAPRGGPPRLLRLWLAHLGHEAFSTAGSSRLSDGFRAGWGALAASSLVLGGLLGLARRWPAPAVGLVLAFGAGALISAVSFDLAEDGLRIGGLGAVGAGRPPGPATYFCRRRPTLTYFSLDRLVSAAAAAGAWACSTASPSRWCWASAWPRVRGSAWGCWSPSSSPPAGGNRRLDRPAGGRPRAGDDPAAVARSWRRTLAAGAGRAGRRDERRRAGPINGFAAGALLVMLVDQYPPRRGRRPRPRRARHGAGLRGGRGSGASL